MPTHGKGLTPAEHLMGDRRRHKRFTPRVCDLTLIPNTKGFLSLFGKKKNVALAVIDLSEGGCRFVTHSQLAVGSHVRVDIHMKLFKDTFEAEGLVAWCCAHPSRTSLFLVGVCFKKTDPAHDRKIASIRDYLSSPEFRQKESTRRRINPEQSLEYLE